MGEEHFPDPVGHFEAPWWPFWIFEVLIEGMIESKNLFSESWLEGTKTKGLTYSQTLSAILDKVGGEVLQAVRHCRRWADAPGAARLVLFQETTLDYLKPFCQAQFQLASSS